MDSDAVCVVYDLLITTIDDDKEVIIFYTFPKLYFTHYHDPSTPLWEVV